MITFAQFGAGRIGAIHAANLASAGGARLRYVVDVNPTAADALAVQFGARASSEETALADPEVGAVIIASSTDTHADLVIAAARAGKAIFCEKPIDLSLKRVDACLGAVREAGVPLFVGFNRRLIRALPPSIRGSHSGRSERSSKSSFQAATPVRPRSPT